VTRRIEVRNDTGGCDVALIARQFARPHGLLGRLVGLVMARSNADFNRWVVHEIAEEHPNGDIRIVELGPGPGIGLEEALRVFSRAHVWGIDLSPEMLSQARKRNLASVNANRLSLIQGNVASAGEIAPVDVIVANHVLYFWPRPTNELAQIHGFLRPDGLLALGYQLRPSMPRIAQRQFPRLGGLYESVGQVEELLRTAGFSSIRHRVKGSSEAPEGHLALATA
jgi:SAM-dependent methyltransferase